MKNTIYGTITAVIITGLLWYIILPVISLSFIGLMFMVIIFGGIITSLGYLTQLDLKTGKTKKKVTHLPGYIGGSIIGIGTIGIIVTGIMSASIITADVKQEMLKVEEVIFDETVPNVDMDNLVIWGESDAIRFSEKLITEKDPSLGSMYHISTEFGTLSVIDGKPYWLFPLEHSGLFKYLKNETVPGYIKVNATNGDAEFVETSFAVVPSAYFENDLKRVIYQDYQSFGLTDYSFEEDTEGQPMWVITAYSHKTGLGTTEVKGVIIVDPVTKETSFHKVGEEPEWVDRVSSVDIFKEHMEDWGQYVNGWWNPSDTGKLQNTNGIGYVFKEGNIYFYTGITSYGGDEATTGFLIYNPRTMVAEYNRISGSTETKAQGLMEELVQNAGYSANYPYLININGEATYLSTLNGNSGNVVGYGMASVKNYRAVAWGSTLREAQTAYNRSLIAEGGSTNSLSDQFSDLKKVKGTVSRVGGMTEGYFIIKLVGNETLFLVSVDQYPMIALTEAGDQVVINYLETEEVQRIDALEFKNSSID